ncbi:MAG TPA: hypothetical protein VGB30_01950 [bacterium]|jgi:transcriptional regulator of heat shock response
MSNMEEFTQSLKGIANKIAVDVKRTTAITKLRMHLTGLDRQRHEMLARLGGRVDELRRNDELLDEGLKKLLEIEFDELDKIEKRMRETMDSIQQISLQDDDDKSEDIFTGKDDKPGEESGPEVNRQENLLDSFNVH